MAASSLMRFAGFVVLLAVVVCTSADDQLETAAYPNQRPYYLRQNTECRGPKVYEIRNVQDVDQCKEACVQFDCAALNLLQLGEFNFVCEILSRVRGYRRAQGAACYIGA